jgi:hypothetical protein
MRYEKGNKYSTGRPKGSKNKKASEVQDFYLRIISEDEGKIREELNQLKGKEYLDIIVKLLPYVIPKPTQSVDLESNAPFQILLTSQIKDNE